MADVDSITEIMSMLDKIDTHINENTDRLIEALNSIDKRLEDVNGWLESIYKK